MSRGQPSWWRGADFSAKAAWLKSTGQARTFEEACGMLGRRKCRTEPPKISVQDYQAALEKRGLG